KLTNDYNVELEEDPALNLPSTSKSNLKSVTLELPKNPLKSPKITQISDRLKLLLNQRTGLVASIAKEGGVNIDDLSLSRKTVRRLRKNVPGFRDGKLLRVPKKLDETEVTNKVLEIVEEWLLSENIYALCFDTTASNIGWKWCMCPVRESFEKEATVFGL
ncbi:hypothetical protein AVEN_237824-1, partial [Araneus ventricosus]